MLASVLYSVRESSSKRSSPLKRPFRSSRVRWRCGSSTSRFPLYPGERLRLAATPSSARALDSLKVFPPEAFLPITLADRQLKRLMRRARREAAVMGVAAVADQRISDPQVQQAVEQRRAEQDGPRQPF